MENLDNLIKKLEKVKSKGWIKAINNHYSGIGITLEHELGINSGNFEIPDYGKIELKTITTGSEPYISLFNATPDSYLFEIKRIHKEYGYPHSKNPKFKVFNISIDGKNFKSISNKYLFILKVDWKKELVILQVYNKFSKKLIDDKTAWSFDLLKEKLNRKLSYLMLVQANKKYQTPHVYYKYKHYQFYTLKNFNEFIKAIEQGIIRITFKININLSGKNIGKIHDHGTSFDIQEKDLDKIFYKHNLYTKLN